MGLGIIMAFSEDYEALERKFCERVQADYDCGFGESTLLRNSNPKGPVDFILIAMEPSFGGRRPDKEERPAEWKDIKEKEIRNFSGSIEDFILHFCVRKYLCQGEQTYYLTDLSKGAMPGGNAGIERQRRYERWYPLLKEELRLVAKPGKTRIIAIGNMVADFLEGRSLCEHVEMVLHYSKSAAGYRENAIRPWKDHFPRFCQTVNWSDIEEAANDVLKQGGYSENSTYHKVKQLQNSSGVTDSRKMLMFHYKNRFEELKTAFHIVLNLDGGNGKGKNGTTVECAGSPIVKLADGVRVRVKQSARAKDFRGRIGTILHADVPGKGTQVEVDGIRKWMSQYSLEGVVAGQQE